MRHLLIIALILSSSTLFAQVEIRPFLGMNFSDVSKTPDQTSSQAKIGYQVGASVMIGNRFHLNPGISYFSRSTEFSQTGDVNFDQTLEGVLIPILVGYRFVDPTTEPFFNFRLYGGPSMVFLTTTKFTDEGPKEGVDWNDTQWGAQLGAGVDVSIFFVDLTYEFGLTDNLDGSNAPGFTDIRQNTFIINAGVRLSFSR
jgi:hypothetical protein